MAGVKVSLNNGAASSPLFAGGNDNEKKKKKPPRPYFIRSQALALGSDVFASASPRRAGRGVRSEAEAEVSERHLLSRSVPRSSAPVSQEQ